MLHDSTVRDVALMCVCETQHYSEVPTAYVTALLIARLLLRVRYGENQILSLVLLQWFLKHQTPIFAVAIVSGFVQKHTPCSTIRLCGMRR